MRASSGEERSSAGRPIQPDLWLCLGTHCDSRAPAYLERELAGGPPAGRAAAGYALARAGLEAQLARRREDESDARVLAHFDQALAGHHSQSHFGELDFTDAP